MLYTFNELRLIHRAMNERWEIQAEVRKDLPEKMTEIMRNDPDPKYRILAAKVLLLAMAQNQKDELSRTNEVYGRVVKALTELGVETACIGIAEEAKGAAIPHIARHTESEED